MTIAEVLAGHQLKLGVRDMLLHCICGWTGSHYPEATGEFLKHQEAALTEAGFGMVTAAKAQALEEAAEALVRLPYARPDSPERGEYERVLAVRRGNADAWLKDRAETVRGKA